MVKKLLTGNEAVARGAYEAGVKFASAYPGTPSTEILESIAKYKGELYAEWAPNEKVAYESAFGASLAGVRSLATMKHVGVNVAADPLFTSVYTGVTGGIVLVSADDPGMHSSQNEQDNRHYALAAKLPMLEPSDSEESYELIKLAYDISERFNTPVLFRMTTRVCHSRSLVETGERVEREDIPYEKNIKKYVATPANAHIMRPALIERLKDLREYSETEAVSLGVNRAEWADDKSVGVVTSGVSYQYAKDAFGEDVSYLKLGMTNPLPLDLIKDFASKVGKLYVVEELDPYLEDQLKQEGIEVIGKEVIPVWNELNADIVANAVFGRTEAQEKSSELVAVPRPPAMCAGCPHRGLFYVLSSHNKKHDDLMITGDIGCYTLSSAPPLSAIDSCICMGASISMGHGAAKISKTHRVVSVIGDSTFLHTGVNSLMNAVYNSSNLITIILDNRITAMTGQQQNPGTGFTLQGEVAPEVDIPLLCKSFGFGEGAIHVVNPLDLGQTEAALEKALETDGPSVIITKWPCVLKKMNEEDRKAFDLAKRTCRVDQEKCKKCKLCLACGCPAIYNGDEITIEQESCTGCKVCQQICPFDAIEVIENGK
ncbi:MAG: indolepyruvate ferredoxin oxidoreductase subunit alpha [Clostridiales Family XIII bacterium]|jgi:indolepyruvate ferredoxin oxidoreductase alpha subunit|nr:indolepyruvate ferredoxin oxidoreductase subunit alpha [Clostridiales Family XIII bacterium]